MANIEVFFPTKTPAVNIPYFTVMLDDGIILIPHLTTLPEVHLPPVIL